MQLYSLLERNGKALGICHISSGMTFIQAALDGEMFLLIFSRRILPCQQQHHAQCQGSAPDSPSFLDAESSGAGLRHKFWAHCSLSSSLWEMARSIAHASTHCSPQSVGDKPTPVERSQRTWPSFPQERLNISTANTGHLCPSHLRLHLQKHSVHAMPVSHMVELNTWFPIVLPFEMLLISL